MKITNANSCEIRREHSSVRESRSSVTVNDGSIIVVS